MERAVHFVRLLQLVTSIAHLLHVIKVHRSEEAEEIGTNATPTFALVAHLIGCVNDALPLHKRNGRMCLGMLAYTCHQSYAELF